MTKYSANEHFSQRDSYYATRTRWTERWHGANKNIVRYLRKGLPDNVYVVYRIAIKNIRGWIMPVEPLNGVINLSEWLLLLWF
jgi:hypothetical protein